MKTTGSSHEKSVLIKSGVECVDWSLGTAEADAGVAAAPHQRLALAH